MLGRALFLYTQLFAYVHTESVLFAYGPAEGDNSLPPNDDDFSDVQDLPVSFRFFGQSYDQLYVNTNGIISFNNGMDDFTPDPFPVANYPIIAVFWGDVDIRSVGEVYFRLIENGTALENITSAVQESGSGAFQATYAYIATWYDVPKFPGPASADRSTFQAVIATDGVATFVIYNYVVLTWTPGQVGFDAGDDTIFYAHEWSLTSDIVRMSDFSNVGVPGRWVFRVDLQHIVDPDHVETTLADTTLAETTLLETTTPAETTSVETTTLAETTFVETTLAETTLAETTFVDTTLAETTLAETTIAATTLADTTSAETTPAETTHAETTPVESTTLEEPAQSETTLPQATSAETTRSETTGAITHTWADLTTSIDVTNIAELWSTGTSVWETTTADSDSGRTLVLKDNHDYPLIIGCSVLLVMAAMATLISCIVHRSKKKKQRPETPMKHRREQAGAYDMELVERQHVPNAMPPTATDTYHTPMQRL